MGVEQGTRMTGDHSVMLWEMPDAPADSIQDCVERFKVTMEQYQAGKDAMDAAEAEERRHADAEAVESDDTSSEVSQDLEDLLWYPNADADEEMTDGGSEDFEDVDEIESEDETSKPVREMDFGGELPARNRVPIYDTSCMQSGSNIDQGAKRKRQSSDLLQSQGHALTVKVPKIIFDSPGTIEAHWHPTVSPPRLLGQPASLREPTSNLKTPANTASPPPAWGSMPRVTKARASPTYWSSNLSKNVAKWLSQAGTQSSQTLLSSVEFKNSWNEHSLIGANAKDSSKVKITLLTLPPSAQPAMAPTKLMKWYVIEIGLKTEKDPLDFFSVPKSLNRVPYWLLAFPVQAVTDSKVEYVRGSAAPMQLQPQNSARKQASKILAPPPPQQVTTFHLGAEARVPLVHGRGISVEFADRFAHACAEGKGMIVLRSMEAVPM